MSKRVLDQRVGTSPGSAADSGAGAVGGAASLPPLCRYEVAVPRIGSTSLSWRRRVRDAADRRAVARLPPAVRGAARVRDAVLRHPAARPAADARGKVVFAARGINSGRLAR
eukprot:gene11773-biopygen877